MITQTYPSSSRRVSEKCKNSRNFQPIYANLKTAESSPARAHGGVKWGYLEFGRKTPIVGIGVHVQEKSCSGPGSESILTKQSNKNNKFGAFQRPMARATWAYMSLGWRRSPGAGAGQNPQPAGGGGGAGPVLAIAPAVLVVLVVPAMLVQVCSPVWETSFFFNS